MRSRGLAGGLTLAALLLGGGVAQAQGPVLEDGKTKAVYDYTKAVRERVFIPQPGIDQDGNGQDDWVTADIIRPSEGSAANKMPAIIDPSPYYTTLCRGAEGQCMADFDGDGVNDRWPLYYDNYFVPRGYAYVLAQMNGTAYTEHGCPQHGGPGDIAGEKSIVDWMNGRVKGYSAASLTAPEKIADWHNGSSAMIGKSYDGTLANGVAATGVEGLKTIVPVSAISAWYNYSRTGGVRQNTNYPDFLNEAITTEGGNANPPGVNLPGRQDHCEPGRDAVSDDANFDNGDGDVHGDVNTFWHQRDYVKDASKVKAAVFITHGLQDDNVRMDQAGMWWDALKANNVPLKMWLLRAGHEDPFESRREEWVTTLHRWFDHWLYGVNNGIMSEPAVTIEDSKDVWGDYASWPIPGTQNVDIFLRAVPDAAEEGTLASVAGGGSADSVAFTTSNSTNETTGNANNNLLNNPTGQQNNRRVFISPALTESVRMSGTASADLMASFGQVANLPAGQNCSTTTAGQQTFRNCPVLSVLVVDLGEGTQTSRSSEGVQLLDTRRCWGAGAPGNVCEGKAIGEACVIPDDSPLERIENACYQDITKPTTDVTSWRVTRGLRDVQNRDTLVFSDAALTPVTVGEKYRLQFPMMPNEHTFEAGHQIAVIVTGVNGSQASASGRPNNVPVALDTRVSKVTLPIVGGYEALADAGLFTDPTAPVGGTVPATLSLSVGPAAAFPPFVPGVGQTYEASTTANVISSAGDALLSVADPSPNHTGHLVNGSFFLPQPLQARARNATTTSPAYNNVGSSASPLNLLSYDGPISNDVVSLDFRQRINQNDALRTGAYTKTLTFTLSTTQP